MKFRSVFDGDIDLAAVIVVSVILCAAMLLIIREKM